MLNENPAYVERLRIPEQTLPVRMWYMYKNEICTLIDVDESNRIVRIKNYADKIMFRAFGNNDLPDEKDRVLFLVEQIQRITGLMHFGEYLDKLFTIDALFLNEDRHMHNIAVLMNGEGQYAYCPIFDNGAGLMSDTTQDYPLNEDILYSQMNKYRYLFKE